MARQRRSGADPDVAATIDKVLIVGAFLGRSNREQTEIELDELEELARTLRTTVVERAPKVLPREDDDVAAEILEILKREGVTVRTDAECMALAKEGRIELTHIPFKGAAPMKQEIIAGRVHFGGDQLSSSLADIKAGKLKAMATSASKRIPELPDVPTVRELGYPILEADGWNGFFAPAKTPRDVLDRLQKEIAAAVKYPEVSRRLIDIAAQPVGSTGAEQEAILKRQMDQFRPIIKEMKIEN